MPPAEPAVVIDRLTMTYGEKVAVDDLSLVVERGTITSVLGPNGAGKTTTLETCEGFRRPQRGRVRVLGLDPQGDRRALLPRIGVMLQSGGAWSGVRASEMLDHVARLHAHPLDPAMLSERLGLAECGRTPYRRLSGGQQQRLGLALALVGRPELVFVDEPTAGMDPQARRSTWELLEELRSDGVTVVLTTHHMDEAERLSDWVHIIDRGSLVASGTPSELTRSAARARLRMSLPALDDAARSELGAILGEGMEVSVRDGMVHVAAPADGATLAAVARWYEHHEVLPVSLTLGQRTLEDVFLELTGREMSA
ncbi:ABC transporter ATP-binding protein [Nocardioides malaquae]|nr:ABC transporter ATP-binding protein [Nocardioides malaquae]